MGKLNELSYLDYLNNFLNNSGEKESIIVNPLQVTQNGQYIAQQNTAYSPVTVNVAIPSVQPAIQSLTVTENGTYTVPSGVDGYSPISVNVPGIVPTGSQTFTENGTFDVTTIAEAVINVANSGGTSNVVTGTFKGTTTGTAMDINLVYSGNGHPVVVLIYPKAGASNPESDFYNLIQRYSCQIFLAVKNINDSAPTYNNESSDLNKYIVFNRHKSSSSGSSLYAQSVNPTLLCSNDNATSAFYYSIVKIKSKTKISVFIADTSYGFAANIDYTYHVIYSS